MPSRASRSLIRGRPVRPWIAGLGGGISGPASAQSSSLISRDGGEDADMLGRLRRSPGDAPESDYLLLQHLLRDARDRAQAGESTLSRKGFAESVDTALTWGYVQPHVRGGRYPSHRRSSAERVS